MGGEFVSRDLIQRKPADLASAAPEQGMFDPRPFGEMAVGAGSGESLERADRLGHHFGRISVLSGDRVQPKFDLSDIFGFFGIRSGSAGEAAGIKAESDLRYSQIESGTSNIRVYGEGDLDSLIGDEELSDELRNNAIQILGRFKPRILNMFHNLLSKSTGLALIRDLMHEGREVEIMPEIEGVTRPFDGSTPAVAKEMSEDDARNGVGTGTTIIFNLDKAENVTAVGKNGEEVPFPLHIILGHELIHARHNAHGINSSNEEVCGGYKNKEEQNTIKTGEITENMLRAEHGLPERGKYYSNWDWYKEVNCWLSNIPFMYE